MVQEEYCLLEDEIVPSAPFFPRRARLSLLIRRKKGQTETYAVTFM